MFSRLYENNFEKSRQCNIVDAVTRTESRTWFVAIESRIDAE